MPEIKKQEFIKNTPKAKGDFCSEDDGSCVTLSTLHANIDAELLETINGCDAFDLLELILKRPELVADDSTLTLLRLKDAELKNT